MPKVGFLVVEDNSELLKAKKKTNMPRIIGWNLVKHAYHEFVKKYAVQLFNKFLCPPEIDALLFSQLYV